MNGFLNIYKEKGMTSHDVVQKIRRISGIKRVGHTGTLDPDAQGVLPICIGKATKASDMLIGSNKCYITWFRLGITTDTQDISGTVLGKSKVLVTDSQLQQAVDAFRGEIFQTPPMYSAIKIKGEKLYALARRGIEIEREQRKITIHKIKVLARNGNDVQLDVECSKGTYIRTLCHDIGKLLGCGACMTELTRTQTACFAVEKSVTISKVESDGIEKHLMPLDDLFDYDKVFLTRALTEKTLNGQDVPFEAIEGKDYRVYGSDGRFLCISKGLQGRLKPTKRFF
ncbi:MAG: tRNA pseudouridine(55) synthase TruB [Firmicutes bacterium]|nr:tRNA pseudouridine(55) synthase TruB [Bacillota bacterium]